MAPGFEPGIRCCYFVFKIGEGIEGVTVRITRIGMDADGHSVFGDIDVPLDEHRMGWASEPIAPGGTWILHSPEGLRLGPHHPSRRQLVVNLQGSVELTVSDGTSRRMGPGDIVLAEDLTGDGHSSVSLDSAWTAVLIPVPNDFRVGRSLDG